MGKRFDRPGARTTYEFGWRPEDVIGGIKPAGQLPKSPQRKPSKNAQRKPSKNARRSLVKIFSKLAPASAPVAVAAPSNVNPNAAPPLRPKPKPKPKPWSWSMICLGAFCMVGGMGTGAFIWLTSLPPVPDCQKISPLSAEMERLYCARELAQSGSVSDLIAALDVVKDWSADQPLYSEAQELLTDWSTALLKTARIRVEQSGLEEAVEIARHIPPSSPVYEESQKAIAAWQIQWKQGEAIYAAAETALKQRNWNEAAAQVPALGQLENDYWRIDRVSDLTKQILTEREAWQTLDQAKKLAASENSEKLGEAIALVQQINPRSYAWAEAKTSLNTWSKTLLAVGLEKWQQGDLTEAMNLVQPIPMELAVDAVAKYLLRFSYAQKLVSQNENQFKPSFGQIWGLMEAVAALRQIPQESSLYALAQQKIETWDNLIQDLTQLQYASAAASLGQRSGLQIAIGQAQQIAPDRPQRVQAQSLIAYWKQQIERIEDQPYLIRARELAQEGTIPALRSAMAMAQQVPLGRALRIDAQTAIASWRLQIETIEDQPFMDQAQNLAKQGKLSEAMQAAAKIRSGRALYDEARAAIASWRAQIEAARIAVDRKILNEANSLAAQTRLSMAIDVASRIGPGRPLYGEARSSIAQWESERADIWSSWDNQDPQPQVDSGYDPAIASDGYSQ